MNNKNQSLIIIIIIKKVQEIDTPIFKAKIAKKKQE